jgi:hypothetical protein
MVLLAVCPVDQVRVGVVVEGDNDLRVLALLVLSVILDVATIRLAERELVVSFAATVVLLLLQVVGNELVC